MNSYLKDMYKHLYKTTTAVKSFGFDIITDDLIINLKRNIRRNNEPYQHNKNRSIYDKKTDCLYKITYLDKLLTAEEKKQFYTDNATVINSMYDCSGKWFTEYIKFIAVENKTVVIEVKSIDC